MKHLVNYCPIPYYEDNLQPKELANLLKANHLDGIEQFIYEPTPPIIHPELTVGIHLKYWPYWLDFYLNHRNYFHKNLHNHSATNNVYWDCSSATQWLEKLKQHFQHSLLFQPEYLVWHVAEANDQEIFTQNFKYQSSTVLKHTADIINYVTEYLPSKPLLLFENLWWPGMNLLNPQEVEDFFKEIKYSNVGIMLDTGHLMNTNPHLQDLESGILYILEITDALGPLKSLIKGIHLNASLSGQYQLNHDKKMPLPITPEKIWQHITNIDQHQPFVTKDVQKLITSLKPEYITHEFSYDSIPHMLELANIQRSYFSK